MKKNRSALKQDVTDNLPSGTGDIKAVDHREIEDNIIDSSLILLEDTAHDIRYHTSGGSTVWDEIEALKSELNDITSQGRVLKTFRTNQFVANNISTGQNIGSPDSGVNVTVSAKSGRDFLLQVSFPSVGASLYVPVLTWVMNESAGGWNANNDIFLTSSNITSSGLRISGRNLNDNPEGHIRVALIYAPQAL